MPSLKASRQGLERIRQARTGMGWTIEDKQWLVEASLILDPDTNWESQDYAEQQIFAAGVSLSTWKRFLQGKSINALVFKAFCQVLGLDGEAIAATAETAVVSSLRTGYAAAIGAAAPYGFAPGGTTSSFAKTDANPVSFQNQKPAPESDVYLRGNAELAALQPRNGNSQRSVIEPEYPERPIALDSPFYIERHPIESNCYQEILKPGSLIRIKAPKNTGKTSLLNRILARAATCGFRTVRLNLRQVEGAVFSHLDKFLRWFCANVCRQLQLSPKLDEYWDEELFGSMASCTAYFQAYLLAQIDAPLVLGLDEVDRLFEYPKIAQDFFALLRGWHEEGNNLEIWQQLRLVVVHSTEIYIPLNINQSPFNVGLPIRLPEFSLSQVQELAQRYGLDGVEGVAAGQGLAPLLALIGGHPYLVQLALYHLRRREVTLNDLLNAAATQAGIYGNYLRRHWENLRAHPELVDALKRVVEAKENVQLEPTLAYKLESMGLVKINGNEANSSCELYRRYFRERLLK